MLRRRSAFPLYCLHRPTGQAVVTIRNADGSRKDVYLGKHGTEASKEEYRRVLAMIESSPTQPATPHGITVAELILAYLRHCDGYYLTADGSPSATLEDIKRSLRRVRELYAHSPADEFGPRDLKAVREKMIAEGHSRVVVNARIGDIKKMFKWGVSEELVKADSFHQLSAVEGLRTGRIKAPDYTPIKPANPVHVQTAMTFMPPAAAALVKLQRMTGARAGELVTLRTVDIDQTSPAVWEYRPANHKGSWRGKDRVLYFGPKCMEVLAPFIAKAKSLDHCLFNPVIEEAERHAVRAEKRKTPRYPSQMKRNENKKPKTRVRGPRGRYTTGTYRQAIERACDAAGVERFTPHTLRHLAATEIRRELGIDVARAVLGHTMAAMSEHYSREVDKQLAMKSVERFA